MEQKSGFEMKGALVGAGARRRKHLEVLARGKTRRSNVIDFPKEKGKITFCVSCDDPVVGDICASCGVDQRTGKNVMD